MSKFHRLYDKLNKESNNHMILSEMYYDENNFCQKYKELVQNSHNTVYIVTKKLIDITDISSLIVTQINKGVVFYILYCEEDDDVLEKLIVLQHSSINLQKITINSEKAENFNFLNFLIRKIDNSTPLPNLHHNLNFNYIMVDGKEFLLKYQNLIDQSFVKSYLFEIPKNIEIYFYTIWKNHNLVDKLQSNDIITFNQSITNNNISADIINSKKYIYLESTIFNLSVDNPILSSMIKRIQIASKKRELFKIIIIVNRRLHSFSKSQQLAITCNSASCLNDFFERTSLSWDEFTEYCSIMFLKGGKCLMVDNNIISIDGETAFLSTCFLDNNNINSFDFTLKIADIDTIKKIEQSIWKYNFNQKNISLPITINDIFTGYKQHSSYLKKYNFLADIEVVKMITGSNNNFLKTILEFTKLW